MHGFPLLFTGRPAFDLLHHAHLPELSKHFHRYRMAADIFLPDAWIALFARWLPFSYLWEAFELIEAEGFPGVLSLTTALLEAHQTALMRATDFPSLFTLLKGLGKQPGQPAMRNL